MRVEHCPMNLKCLVFVLLQHVWPQSLVGYHIEAWTQLLEEDKSSDHVSHLRAVFCFVSL